MRTLFNKKMATLLAACLVAGFASAKDVFVRVNASGTGESWDNAANINYLGGSSIADGDVIHVAAGDYLRTTQISIAKYVTVIGGYSVTSTGTDLSKRDIATNKTVIKPDASSTTRGMTINITTAANGNLITLDGLNLDGFAMTTGNGGTALNITASQGDILIKNCTFSNNISLNANGGAINMGSIAYNIAITFDNCTFTGNQANWTSANGYGGAIYFNNGSTAKTINLTGCNFNNNSAYGRGGALYFTSSITCNITDCVFDTNFSSNTTDNLSTGNGGCIYVVGGSVSNVFDVKRTIFVNGSNTAKGSIIWFNTTPKNSLTMTNCSMIGNYAKRGFSATPSITGGRAAIDCDGYANLDVVLNSCVLSNYNNSSTGIKQSKYADLMIHSPANSSTTSTFTNTIVNGAYFGTTRNNTYDATQPDTLYNKEGGYLADSTISLALSGDLKITDKIVFKKTFTAANVGNYIHAQIFDVKKKMNFPMTLVASIPVGYALSVDGIDYASGTQTIQIAAAPADPIIVLKVASGLTKLDRATANIHAVNGQIYISNVENGSKLSAYNAAGQLIHESVVNNGKYNFAANGFVVVKLRNSTHYQTLKVVSK